MKTQILISALVLALAAVSPASAACFADYKAKKDNPLRLHYGVAKLSDSTCDDVSLARAQISDRIGADGWQLLSIVTVFDETGLEQRKESAGQYFLRY